MTQKQPDITGLLMALCKAVTMLELLRKYVSVLKIFVNLKQGIIDCYKFGGKVLIFLNGIGANSSIKIILLAFAILMFSSCKHKHYDEPEIVLNLTINFPDDDYEPLSRSEIDWYMQIVLVSKTDIETKSIFSPGGISTLSIQLKPECHDIYVCATHGIPKFSLDVPYLSILPPERYNGMSDLFVGKATIDNLQENTAVVTLTRPFAKFRIISTNASDSEYNLKDLSTTVSYQGFMPTMMNLNTMTPCDASTGYGFTSPASEMNNGEIILAEDFIFANNSESFVNVAVQVNDKNNQQLHLSSNLKIPYKRGYITTIRGDFLKPNEPGSGITIDTEWGGQYEIEF